MAFTRIASLFLPKGHTSHKTGGLKVPLTAGCISNIKPGSAKARELTEIDIFLMDEVLYFLTMDFKIWTSYFDVLVVFACTTKTQ